MKTDELMDAWSAVDQKYLEEANRARVKKQKGPDKRRTAVLLAAAAALILGLGLGSAFIIRNYTGKNSGPAGQPGENLTQETRPAAEPTGAAQTGEGRMNANLTGAAVTEEKLTNAAVTEEYTEPETVLSELFISPLEEWGVEAKLLSYDSSTQEIEFSYTNNSNRNMMYGNIAYLEILQDGSWYTIVSHANVTAEAYYLYPGETKKLSGKLTLYGTLKPGHYRFVRRFTDELTRKTFNIAFEFDHEGSRGDQFQENTGTLNEEDTESAEVLSGEDISADAEDENSVPPLSSLASTNYTVITGELKRFSREELIAAWGEPDDVLSWEGTQVDNWIVGECSVDVAYDTNTWEISTALTYRIADNLTIW
ncbi:MAG: hypothetical protein IKR59_03565 [Lachnospiraceae bacterium]|nr:hypothetical protein [Lachnospiraceae bacterium]